MLQKAANCEFTALKRLSLGIFNFRNEYDVSPLDRAAGAFIASLRPLEAIHMSGPFLKKSFKAILDHHGKSLRTLSLYPSEDRLVARFVITPTQIREIKQHCTKLYDLRLQIQRSAGDHEEQAIYKALGELPQLRQLSLRLDVYNAMKFANRAYPWQVESRYNRDILINMALDRQLAGGIFSLIAKGSPIESLRLSLGMDVPESFLDISQVMKRKWKCSRVSMMCPEEDKVIVQELGAKNRKRRMQANKSTQLREYEEVFRELWPSNTGNWMDDWHSFPLAG
jgi:hypothetical protein